MSGPVTASDTDIADAVVADGSADTGIEVTTGRAADVGGIPVHRVLPHRPRRTVGAWCFVDHFGPTTGRGMAIGPHPHIGLQTVTWLLEGEVVHRDSLGSEQPIRPGQLNLMTAGHGIAHAEEAHEDWSGTTHGAQLWIAQPEATRHGPPAFEHHHDLPVVDDDGTSVTVLVGSHRGASSPARHDTPLVGLDVELRRGSSELPLDEDHEHAIVVLEGDLAVDDLAVPLRTLAYVPLGRTAVRLGSEAGARLLLLGGEPLGEPVLMSWNFVARSRDEVDRATIDWNDGAERFGVVASALDRIPAPRPPWA